MREIKFRGKSVEDDSWIVGNLSITQLAYWINNIQVHENTIGQYTGVKEFLQKGKEIFEGDVVKWKDWGGEEQISSVCWDEGMCRFVFRNRRGRWMAFSSEYYMEVIGHISTHSDLVTE